MSRNPDWNIQRTFKRAEVYFVNLPEEPLLDPDASFVMSGDHRVVVLYDSEYPRNTVTVLPITSLYDANGIQKTTIPTDFVMKHADYENSQRPYRGTIRGDSCIRMDQIRSISRHYLERCVGEVLPEDMILIDLRLITSLQLQETVSLLVESKVQEILGESGYTDEQEDSK
ncbi:type II toxin-antitoxin system PemK/MazF family toxin [Paenibacillus taichungensis]|uniref:type II toxin-antitoxin system PemK/MazF family toxin n=1 Tax=Paenibacillus taichungensis TaxID=484184 RepID=UPI0039A00D0B